MIDTAYDRVRKAVEDAGLHLKTTGPASFQFQAPEHSDGDLSVSVRDIGGQTLIHSFSEETEDVLTALGLTFADLYNDEKGIKYEYQNLAGDTVRTVTRTPNKKFSQHVVDKGTVPLYHLADVVNAVHSGQTVYICEGEKDANTLRTLGVCATTAPQGAQSWAKADYTPLSEAHAVVIVADNDKAGMVRAHGLYAHLMDICTGDVSAVIPADGLKDAADHIMAGHSLADFQPIPDLTPSKSSLYFDMALFLVGGMPEPPAPTVLARSDGVSLFYSANVNTIYGDPESGKTWVALAAVAETVMSGGKAVVIDLDHNGPQTTVTRLQMLGLTVDQLSNPELFAYVDPEDPAHLNKVVADLKEHPANVVVFDSLGEVMPFYGLNSNSPDDFTGAFRTVINPPALAGACVVVIDHLAKGTESRAKGATGTYAKKRAIGGVSLKATVQTGYAPGHGGETLLTVEKDRNGGLKQHCPIGGDKAPVAAVFELIPAGGWNVVPPKDGQRNPDEEANPELVDRLLKANPFPANVADATAFLRCRKQEAGKALKEARRIFGQSAGAETARADIGKGGDGVTPFVASPASSAVPGTRAEPGTGPGDAMVPGSLPMGAEPGTGPGDAMVPSSLPMGAEPGTGPGLAIGERVARPQERPEPVSPVTENPVYRAMVEKGRRTRERATST